MQLIASENSKVQEMSAGAIRSLKNKADWKESSLKFFKKHKSEVEEIISRPLSQKAIGELANDVLSEGMLNGREAAAVLERGFGGHPKDALPTGLHLNDSSQDSSIDTLAAAMKKTSQLTKLALDTLRSYSEKDSEEEKVVDQVARKLLEVLFLIDGIFQKL